MSIYSFIIRRPSGFEPFICDIMNEQLQLRGDVEEEERGEETLQAAPKAGLSERICIKQIREFRTIPALLQNRATEDA